MNDVFGQILLTAGNKNLAASDAITAIVLRLGAGADQAEIGASMGFRQAHGAGPAALVHRRQVAMFQLRGGMGVNGQASAGAKGRIQREAAVGAVQHLFKTHG